jgi:hypothetical protein
LLDSVAELIGRKDWIAEVINDLPELAGLWTGNAPEQSAPQFDLVDGYAQVPKCSTGIAISWVLPFKLLHKGRLCVCDCLLLNLANTLLLGGIQRVV